MKLHLDFNLYHMTIYFMILFYIFSIVFIFIPSFKRSLLRNCSKSDIRV
jgi:hypothetical protein